MSKLFNIEEYKKLQTSYSSLQNYKDTLEQRVQEEISKRQVHEKILARKTRLVAMGEMMDAVAHQWSQPLSIIDMHVNLMIDDFKNNLINKQYVDDLVHSINIQTTHLLSTLNKFRHFLRPIDKNELFDLNVMVQNTLTLLHDEIVKHHINIQYIQEKESITYGSINEVQHVLINLLNNAKDSFNAKKIQNRFITITIKNKSLYYDVIVQDNAGGIDKNIIDDIFKPYISTKDLKENSGIGLYMSCLIMQKHNGKICAKNIGNGARFTIKFYKEQ